MSLFVKKNLKRVYINKNIGGMKTWKYGKRIRRKRNKRIRINE